MLARFLKSPYLSNLPIFFIYGFFIFLKKRTIPEGDGTRYWDFSTNLLEGSYAIGDGPGFLWNGPGYPIFLAFFRLLNFNVFFITLLNSILIYLSCVLLVKITELFINNRKIISIVPYLFIISSPFLLITSTYLYTEPLTIFLVNLGCFLSLTSINNLNYKRVILASLIFGFLILTKVIFAYVFLLIFSLSIIKLLFVRSKKELIIIMISFFSLVFTFPYQIYTFNITKKIFYFSDAGGDLLYWLSSPHEEDLGQWHEKRTPFFDATVKNKYSNLNADLIMNLNNQIFHNREKNHGSFLKTLEGLNGIEKDQRLKEKAIDNIKKSPSTFIKNIFLNVSRLFLGYPFSLYFKPPYTPVRSVINILLSSFFLWFNFFGLISSIANNLFKETRVQFILTFILIYLGGMSFLANQSQRFLLPISGLLLTFSMISIYTYFKNLVKNNNDLF